jgi:hypothetical protein
MCEQTIYFDYSVGYGVNAYSRLYESIHYFFRTMSEFETDCMIDYPNAPRVELTADNYESLRIGGLFNGLN